MRKLGLLVVAALVGCAPSARRVAEYASDAQAAQWAAIAPGRKILVADPLKSCVAEWAEGSIIPKSGGRPLSEAPWADDLTVFTIDSVAVSGTKLDLTLSAVDQKIALRLPGGADACLWPADGPIANAIAAKGRKVSFAPWRPSCAVIEARGSSPLDALEDGGPFQVSRVALGAPTISKHDGSASAALWYTIHDDLAVRADTFDACFETYQGEGVVAEALSLLRLDAGRCLDLQGGHLECATSVGSWVGTVDDGALSLTFVRRTLGSVHILDGQPVEGSAFARAIVAVELASTTSDLEQKVNSSIKALTAGIAGEDPDVRLVSPGDPKANTHVNIVVRDVLIGDVVHSQTVATQKYKAGTETKENPAKQRALDEVDTAKDALAEAEKRYERELAEWEALKAQANKGCVDNLTQGGWLGKVNCAAGTTVAGSLVKPDNPVPAARQRLEQAKQKAQSTPATIEVPIYKHHAYTKKTYSRTVRATLRIDTSVPGATVKPYAGSFSFTREDYEVQSDPEHEIVGHSPDPTFLEQPESMIPHLARKVAEQARIEVRAAIDESLVAQAAIALADAGMESTKVEFAKVDALAFRAVGPRLRKLVRRGKYSGTKKNGLELPTGAELGKDECVLAVVVAAGTGDLKVKLHTPNGSHADERGKSHALLEVCGGEIAAKPLIALHADGEVRWGVYRTSRAVPKASGTARKSKRKPKKGEGD